MNIVEILQVGFTGFAFLMTGYSFRLIRPVVTAKKGTFSKTVERVIKLFMGLSLAMTTLSLAVVIVDKFWENASEREERIRRSEQAQECLAALREVRDGAVPADAAVAERVSAAITGCESTIDALSFE